MWTNLAQTVQLSCTLQAGGQTTVTSKREELCESGLPDADVCGVDWDEESEDEQAVVRKSTVAEAWARGRWLLGLLVLQVGA